MILNRVGSARHEEILRDALDDLGVPVLGALRRDDGVTAPSRHLGLVPVAEREGPARQALDRLGAVVGAAVDLDAVLRLAASAGPLSTAAWSPRRPSLGPSPRAAVAPRAPAAPHGHRAPHSSHGSRRPDTTAPRRGPVVAVAGGAAFSFSYAETAELLAAAGAEVARVDPLRDEALPPGTAALVLGGGFPEVHVADLAANERLRADVARLARAGRPVVAECAGLLYLARELDGQPMCGVLDATAGMTSPAHPRLPGRDRRGRLGGGAGRGGRARPRIPPHRRRSAALPRPRVDGGGPAGGFR